jgi:putative flippase GtrA
LSELRVHPFRLGASVPIGVALTSEVLLDRESNTFFQGAVAGAHAQFGRHALRFGTFSFIGGTVFLLGFALLYVEVSLLGMPAAWAFLLQGVISVETSYLLNWRITWRHRRLGFWRSLWRFNLLKSVTIPLNQGLFMLLLALGLQYLVANVATVAIFTLVNYGACHLWAFRLVPAPAMSPCAERSEGCRR